MSKKGNGFNGQRAIVLPKKVLEKSEHTPIIDSLHITDIGFYPRAEGHYRQRHAGSAQNILIYCVEGSGWLKVPSGFYHVNPNEYFVIPANMPHKYGADEKNPWTIYWAHFRGSQSASITALLARQSKSMICQTLFLEERIHVFDAIYSSLQAGYGLDNLMYANMSFQYFLSTFAFADKFIPANQIIEKDPVHRSIEFMQSHIGIALTLESLASAVNLSPSHYTSMFKLKTGYSPIAYFNHLKVQKACQYLQFTALRVNEIAAKLGIEDPYYFSRLFTKVMGISPLMYRHKKK